MNESEDISTLFAKFGGRADLYQEVRRDDEALASKQRWPLLSLVHPGVASIAPAVGAQTVAQPSIAASPESTALESTVLESTAPERSAIARQHAATAQSRQLSAVFARLAGGAPASNAPRAQDEPLSSRLRRL